MSKSVWLPGYANRRSSRCGSGERRWIVECELGKDVTEEIARRAVQRAWGLAELTPLSMSLEEVFLNLTGSDTAEASS